jgi:DNA polymerase
MSDRSPQDALRQTIAGLRGYVERLAESGIEEVPRGPALAPTGELDPFPSMPREPVEPAAFAPAEPARDAASGEALAAIRADIGDCRRCKLCGGRTNIVFGVGNPRADVLFVGEGPGQDEDFRGEPFVGRAGQLLTDIITRGMGLERSDVYIANVVKCRPPNNRNPEPDEIAACRPFLERQIDAIRPKVVVALGKFAAQTLLATTTPISRLRGQWHVYRGIKLMPTFHPSYLLRNPDDKRLVWADIRQVMRELGLPEPRSRPRS